jgi:hypothetical protein
MKLKVCALIFFSVLSYTSLYAQNQKISLSVNHQPLKKVFDMIQNKSRYRILYSDEVVSDSLMVSIQASRQPVSEILDAILLNKNLSYTFTLKDLIVIRGIDVRDTDTTMHGYLQTVISGKVSDGNQNLLPFVSVMLLQDHKNLIGVATDENGNFTLPGDYTSNEKYTIKLTSIGYDSASKTFVYPDTGFMKHIVLTRNKNTLKAVTVLATKNLITRKSDRYIINVENSFLSDGFSALEVLQKSPGIWVDGNGTITLKGNQPVMVMINDVVQRMSGDELSEYLKTLKSEDISKIEVISNPPSEFEASGSGGIIHIILKKSRKDGLNGSVQGRYAQQGKKPYYSTGTSLNYKVKNLYLFGSLFYVKDKSYYLATYHIVYPDNGIYNSITDRNNNNSKTQYRFGLAYDISKNQSIGIQTMGNPSRYTQSFVTGIDFSSQGKSTIGQANSEWFRNPNLSSTTINYLLKTDTSGSMLKIIGDYTRSNKTETNNFSSVYNDLLQNSIYRNNTPNTTNIYSLQADYTKVLKHKLEYKGGAKYVSTERDNKLINEDYTGNQWILNAAKSNYFIYNENLLMAYSSLEKTLKSFSIKAGLRAEETFVKGNSVTSDQQFSKNYLGLFPSLFILKTFNEEKGSSMHLNYTRRLQRPSFSVLNPYRLQIDNFTYIIGNPDLLPQYTHSVELGYDFLKGYSANIYFSSTKNVIAELANPINNDMLEYQTKNFNNSTNYGFSFYAPARIFKWWITSNSLSLYNLSYRINDYQINQNTLSLQTAHTFTIKNVAEIDADAAYRSPYVDANSRFSAIYYADLGISKKIFKNKGRVRFYVSDIFNTFREKNVTNYKNTQIDFYQKRPTRTFSIGFSYNFSSGKKFNNKKIEQSNVEEKNRIGN